MVPPKAETSSREIKGLTSLRGIAAFYIVMLHFSATAQTAAKGTIPALAPGGILAVDLFFVLSGFIMAYTYINDFRKNGLRAFPDFLGRRFARIEPLNVFLLLTLSLIALVTSLVFGHSPFPEVQLHNLRGDLLANLMLLQGIGVGHNLNGPSWSISDEFAAYLIFPLLLGLVFHRRMLVCGLSVAAALTYLILMASKQPNLGMDPTIYGIYWDVGRCFSEFTLGLASYRFFASPRWRQALSSDAVFFGISFALAAIVLLRLGQLYAALLFPFLILAIARNRGFGQKILEHRILYFMGLISYSLYLVHDPIRPLERGLLVWLHPEPLGTIPAMACALVGSLSVIAPAWLTYTYIEQPGRRLFRGLFGSPERAKAELPAMPAPSVAESQ